MLPVGDFKSKDVHIMKILVLLSIIMYHAYLIISAIKFDITASLSETHYKWLSKIPSGALFTLFCWAISFTVMIPMLEYTGPMYKFVPFFAGSGLMLVGAAPWFKDSGLERNVHYAGALLSIIFSYLWAFAEGNMYVTGIAAILTAIIFLVRKNINRIYWVELIAFTNIYVQLILKIWN